MADGPVTVTVKAGAGFEAPWLVVSGEWGDVVRRLSEVGFDDDHIDGLVEAFKHNTPVGLHGVKEALGATDAPAPAPPVSASPARTDKPTIRDPDSPMSDKQGELIAKLKGVVPPGGLTKGAASEYIDSLMQAKR